jgi:hypothetical protein
MGLQAIEMIAGQAMSSLPVSHEASEHVPGIQPGELP